MIIVKAQLADLSVATKIIKEAIAYLAKQGVDQWQQGYPNEAVLAEDIAKERLFLIKDIKEIAGLFVLVNYDENYDVIEGSWLSAGPYVAIHRFAIAEKYRRSGVSTYAFDWLKRHYDDLRIDTHKDNVPMNNCLLKNAFQKCGIVYLKDGSPRVVYEYWRYL